MSLPDQSTPLASQRSTRPSKTAPDVAPVASRWSHADWWTVPAVAAVILTVGLVYGRLLGGTQWDADEGIMLMQARLLGQGFPLYTEVWSDHPPGVPLSLLAGFRLLGESVETGRLVVLLYGLVGLGAVAWLAALLAPTRRLARVAAVAAPLALALTPNFFWLARSVVRDIPPLSVGVLAIALALTYARAGRLAWLVAAGALFGWALWLKFIAAALVAPLLLFALGRVWTAPSKPRELVRVALALALGGLPLALLFLVNFDLPAFTQQALATPIQAREVWPNRAWEYAGWVVEYLTLENLGLAALAALGLLLVVVRRPWTGAVTLAWLALTVLSLVNQRPLFAKHHFALLLYPLAALAGLGLAQAVETVWRLVRRRLTSPPAPLLEGEGGQTGEGVSPSSPLENPHSGPLSLWERIRVRVLSPLWLLASLAALGAVAVQAPRQIDLLGESVAPSPYTSLLQAADWVRQNSGPADFVVTDPPMIAFRAGRNQVPGLTVLSSKMIETGVLTDAEAIRMTQAYRPVALANWNNRIDRLEGYTAWLRQRYIPVSRDKDRSLWLAFDPARVQHAQAATFSDVAELLGYDLASKGAQVELTTYWRALASPPKDYTLFAHLVGPDGQLVGQRDGPPGGGAARTSTWAPGEIILDRRTLTRTQETSGPLRLYIGLYDPANGARLPAFAGGQRVDGDSLGLDTMVVMN